MDPSSHSRIPRWTLGLDHIHLNSRRHSSTPFANVSFTWNSRLISRPALWYSQYSVHQRSGHRSRSLDPEQKLPENLCPPRESAQGHSVFLCNGSNESIFIELWEKSVCIQEAKMSTVTWFLSILSFLELKGVLQSSPWKWSDIQKKDLIETPAMDVAGMGCRNGAVLE